MGRHLTSMKPASGEVAESLSHLRVQTELEADVCLLPPGETGQSACADICGIAVAFRRWGQGGRTIVPFLCLSSEGPAHGMRCGEELEAHGHCPVQST